MSCFSSLYTARPPRARILQGRRAAGGASGPGMVPSAQRPAMTADSKAKASKPHQMAAAGGAKGTAAVPSALQLPHGGRTLSVAAAGGARGSAAAAVPPSPPSPPGGNPSSHQQMAEAGVVKGSAAGPPALQLPHGGKISSTAAAGAATGVSAVLPPPPCPPGGKPSSTAAAGAATGASVVLPPPPSPPGGKPLPTAAAGGARGSAAVTPVPPSPPGGKVAAAGEALGLAVVPPAPPSPPSGKRSEMAAAGGARGSAAVPSSPGGKKSSKTRTMRLEGVESLQNSNRSAIGELSTWFDGYRIGIDSDGNCFGAAWMVSVLLWAVQSKDRTTGLVKRLQDASKTGGAFCCLSKTSKGHVAYLVRYAKGLQIAWELFTSSTSSTSPTDHGTSLATGVVRVLRGSAGTVDGFEPLRIKRGLIIAARAFDVLAAPTCMEPKDLETLRTVGESVVFNMVGEAAAGFSSDNVMRPARGLNLVVGMVCDSIRYTEGVRRLDREDFTQFFRGVAVDQPLVGGLAVLKGGLSHYDVFAAAGTPFGDALAREFKLPNMSCATDDAALGILEKQTSSQVKMTHEDVKGLDPEDKELAADLENQAEILEQIMAENAKQRASSSQGPG